MHRTKIGLIAAGLLLAATVGVYSAVTTDLRDAGIRDIEERVTRAQLQYQQIHRLGGIDIANLAAERAHGKGVVAVFDRADETARREAAFAECESLNAGFEKKSRKADIVAFIDSTGKVIARDLNPNAMWGDDLRSAYPAVDRALKGEAVSDVWTLANRMTHVAVAPVIKPDGTIVGGLLIGFGLSAKQAQENRDLLGTEIAYFHAGKVQASSFVRENNNEDVNRSQALNAILFQGSKPAETALHTGAPTSVSRAVIEGREYAMLAAPLSGNFADRTSGVAVLSSVSDERESVHAVGLKVIMLGFFAIVVALAVAVSTAKRFLGPLDRIELGVAEVINGNIDYTFKPVGPDFEGLSNALNVMLARLLGREEPNEDTVEEEDGEVRRWKAEQMIIEEGDGAAAGPGGQALAQESEAAYHPRLFNEYITALRTLGKPAEGVSVPAFTAKLRLAEAGLRQKWSCRIVRFQVVTRGDQVVFKAVRIQ